MISIKSVLVLLTSVVCFANAENLAGGSEEGNKILEIVKKSKDVYEKTTENVKKSLKDFDESQQATEHGKVKTEVEKVEAALTELKAALEAVTKLPEDGKYKGKTEKKDVEALTKELRTKLDAASEKALAWDLAYITYSDVYHVNKKAITNDESFSLKRFENLAKIAASGAHFMFAGVAAVAAAVTLLLA